MFFDRDGVVNESPGAGYVTRWEEFVLNQGIREALALCKARGYLTILVTSQRCVARGLISLEGLDRLHAAMQQALGAEAAFDGIHAFTGLPGTAHLEKPKPGLVLEAASALNVDPGRSWLVGDADRDILMAQNAGIATTVRVRTQHPVGVEATWTVDTIRELAAVLEQQLPAV